MKSIKKRHWACVIYPESLPENWREIIAQSGLQCALSPLHDKDVNADGEVKKAHYHLLFTYDNPASTATAKLFADKLNAPAPQWVDSLKGYYRYLTHKDNPEKAQYSEAEIEHFGGFNPLNLLSSSEIAERNKQANREVIKLIREMEITEYSDLIDILLDGESDNEDFTELYEYVASHTIFFCAYLQSKRYKQQERGQRKA